MVKPKFFTKITRGHFSRSRNLFDFRFSKELQKDITKRVRTSKQVKVVEIGCGEGRVLMELKKQFPSLELYGINKKPWPAMKGISSLRRTGVYYEIFTKEELKNIKLPKISFYDASKLKFKSNSVDIIYSQVAIHYVQRKDLLLEEVWRVLKPGGIAFLHIDNYHESYPDFMQFRTPRFIIYHKDGKVVMLKSFVHSLKKKGFSISLVEDAKKSKNIQKELRHLGPAIGTSIIIRKTTHNPLRLNLIFDKVSSFNLSTHEHRKELPSFFWGYRSVFSTK